MARAELVRHQMFLQWRLSEQLEALAIDRQASKPAILANAIGPDRFQAFDRAGQQPACGRLILVPEDAR